MIKQCKGKKKGLTNTGTNFQTTPICKDETHH